MGFSSQEYWSRLWFPSPGGLSDTGIESVSLASPELAGRFFTTTPPRLLEVSIRVCKILTCIPFLWGVPKSCIYLLCLPFFNVIVFILHIYLNLLYIHEVWNGVNLAFFATLFFHMIPICFFCLDCLFTCCSAFHWLITIIYLVTT